MVLEVEWRMKKKNAAWDGKMVKNVTEESKVIESIWILVIEQNVKSHKTKTGEP